MSCYHDRWGFSRLLIHCNDITPGLLEKLPPTDSRRRADIRALEACKADQVGAIPSHYNFLEGK